MKSYFPDVNVWLALVTMKHRSHFAAAEWLDSTGGDRIYFSRFTQLAFLRLLTHAVVMRDEVKTQVEAWRGYDLLLEDERISFLPEPDSIDIEFRKLTSKRQHSSNDWPDAYLAAFARSANLTLVTFDRALSRLPGADAVLLTANQ
jgi:toxin-antitoxin system PIN domain toxin